MHQWHFLSQRLIPWLLRQTYLYFCSTGLQHSSVSCFAAFASMPARVKNDIGLDAKPKEQLTAVVLADSFTQVTASLLCNLH